MYYQLEKQDMTPILSLPSPWFLRPCWGMNYVIVGTSRSQLIPYLGADIVIEAATGQILLNPLPFHERKLTVKMLPDEKLRFQFGKDQTQWHGVADEQPMQQTENYKRQATKATWPSFCIIVWSNQFSWLMIWRNVLPWDTKTEKFVYEVSKLVGLTCFAASLHCWFSRFPLRLPRNATLPPSLWPPARRKPVRHLTWSLTGHSVILMRRCGGVVFFWLDVLFHGKRSCVLVFFFGGACKRWLIRGFQGSMHSQQFVWCIGSCYRLDKPNGTCFVQSMKKLVPDAVMSIAGRCLDLVGHVGYLHEFHVRWGQWTRLFTCCNPATYQARNWTLGLWCVDSRVFPIQEAGSQPQCPKKWEGLTLFLRVHYLKSSGKKHIKKNLEACNINLHFGWNPKVAHPKLAEVVSPAPDSWSIGALCGPSGSGKSVNMRNLGSEAVLSHGMMESSGHQWQIDANWAIFFWGGQWQETVVEGKLRFIRSWYMTQWHI